MFNQYTLFTDEEINRIHNIHQMTLLHGEQIIKVCKEDSKLNDEDFLKWFTIKKFYKEKEENYKKEK